MNLITYPPPAISSFHYHWTCRLQYFPGFYFPPSMPKVMKWLVPPEAVYRPKNILGPVKVKSQQSVLKCKRTHQGNVSSYCWQWVPWAQGPHLSYSLLYASADHSAGNNRYSINIDVRHGGVRNWPIACPNVFGLSNEPKGQIGRL